MSGKAIGEPSRALTVAAVTILAVASAAVQGADPRAEFPRGDGGLFFAIVSAIVAGHFHFPRFVAYDGLQIPFAYSPLAFYGVAALAVSASTGVAKAMNLWVIAWDALIAPAAYVAARRFLATRSAALVAAAALVLTACGDLAFLGVGGAVTRAPGYVAFLLGCAAIHDAFSTGRLRSAIAGGACAAAAAWLHVEFAFLLAVSYVVLIAFDRPKAAPAVAVAVAAALLALPLALLDAANAGAIASAMRFAGRERTAGTLFVYAANFGITPPQNWLWIASFGSALAGCFARRYFWLVWAIVLLTVDSVEGPRAARLPLSLALGWAFATIRDLPQLRERQPAIVLFALLAFEIGFLSARGSASGVVRVQSADVADARRIAAAVPANAWVVPVYPGAIASPAHADETFEWLPALGGVRTPVTFQGLEWIDPAAFRERARNFDEVSACTARGAACVADFIRRRVPPGPVFVFVPNHGAAYPLVVSGYRADPRFASVFGDDSGALFRFVPRASGRERPSWKARSE